MKKAISCAIIAVFIGASSIGYAHGAEVEVSPTNIVYDHYHDYNELVSLLGQIVTGNSSIAAMHELGTTWEGRKVLAVKVSDNVGIDETHEPDILYMGAHHGNELISAEVPLYILDFIVSSYASNSTIKDWVDTREIWFIPMVNPDGIEATHAGFASRKNRRPIDLDDDGTPEDYGVDLNRNYGHLWGTQGTSSDPSAITYCGEYPFSENETKAVRKLAVEQNLTFSMSFHSYGRQVFFPWGNTIDSQHPEREMLEAVASEIAERNGYQPMEGKYLYATSGDSDDWLYANTSCLPFTIELATEFVPDESQILGICQKNLDSSLYLLEIAEDKEKATLPEWTFMVYMAADNSLTAAALDDMQEMAEAGSTDDVNIVVLYDGNLNGDSKLFLIQKDMEFDLAPHYHNGSDGSGYLDDGGAVIDPVLDEADMSSTTTLSDFVDWVNDNYPAQKTALDLWDHGNGLFGGLFDDKGSWMDTWELRDAIDENYFDIIGLDLCWQGQAETAYEVMGAADVFIGSAAEEPEDGWDYARSLGYLAALPEATPDELANRIVDDFLLTNAASPYITLAAIDMVVFESGVIPALDSFSAELTEWLYYNASAVRSARNNSATFDDAEPDFVDLYEFLNLLVQEDIAEPVREKALALAAALENCTIRSGHGANYQGLGGLAIYFPEQSFDNRYTSNLRFAAENWDEMLAEFLNPSQWPVISHTPLSDVLTAEGPYEISARITDDNMDPDGARLFYSVDGEIWPDVQMTSEGGDYTALIPGQPHDTTVQYYIRATDLDANEVTYPADIKRGGRNYLSFTVKAHVQLSIPSVTFTPLSDIENGTVVTFNVQVENAGLMSATSTNITMYLIDSTLADIYLKSVVLDVAANSTELAELKWNATAGNNTLSFVVYASQQFVDTDSTDNSFSLDIDVMASEVGQNGGGGGNATSPGDLNIWLLPILALAIASVLSMGVLMVGRRQVNRKKRETALRSIIRNDDFIQSVREFGVDTSHAERQLALARNEVRLGKYDKAMRLSREAKESCDLALMDDGDKKAGWGS